MGEKNKIMLNWFHVLLQDVASTTEFMNCLFVVAAFCNFVLCNRSKGDDEAILQREEFFIVNQLIQKVYPVGHQFGP